LQTNTQADLVSALLRYPASDFVADAALHLFS
jgi:hypothetical protein